MLRSWFRFGLVDLGGWTVDDFAQPAVGSADLDLLAEHAGDCVPSGGLVERPDGRVYIGPQASGRFATIADFAWGRALRELQAGHVPPVADIDRALASLVVARAEPGEALVTAAERLAATGDVVFGTLYAGRRQACQVGPDAR